MSKCAWVTLATNDSYSLGALVVAHSLRKVSTKHQLAVLITPGVTESMIEKLQDVFDVVQLVDVLDSKDSANLAVLKRPELGVTFTKLHCWNLIQFEKCVFLDADVLVLQNCDELFEREELSAAPDVGWPDCFNSGVFVFTPSVDTYGKMIQFAETSGSFDGGDQGLLNQYFSNWSTDGSKRLPFLYNTASTATYSYLPAFKKFNQEIKILHFIGETKPWSQHFDSSSKQVQTPPGYNHLQCFLQMWWDLFCDKVHPSLTQEMNEVGGVDSEPLLQTYLTEIQFDSTSTEDVVGSDESETPSYSPYLIEYHEDTNTFTYNDPWIEMDNNSNNNCNTDISLNVEINEIPKDTPNLHESVSTELIIPPQPVDHVHFCDSVIEKDIEEENIPLIQAEVAVEHVPESGIAGALATLALGSDRTPEQVAYENQFRRANWEAGQIDYLGQDSFDNILKKIQETIEAPPAEVVEQREPPVTAKQDSPASAKKKEGSSSCLLA
ncbi:CLUMA_CG009037, isoform B [Clunio marinus]|uniref:glycogenin glucosyltransferase n=1 Tax=Clunio marinus TaxID=568069 RepID=A0A1J1I5G0_9DIPT|nr:CLUMA_CG009037, isoform B [Clunio marinus]